ncbi:MAG: carboxypeptidase-like regulatory domain-containing protein [Elusimicrobiota bacterium]
MIARCPSCHTNLEAFETTCPVCMRERTREEMFTAQSDEAESTSAVKKRGFGFLWLLVGFGVVGYGYHMHTQKKLMEDRAAAQEKAAVSKGAEKAVPHTAAAGAAPEEKITKWTIGGEVYDLLSLKPVKGAQLVFTDKAKGSRYKTKTDAKGRYTIKLPKLKDDGYELVVKHRRYRGVYLEEETSRPLKRQDRESRLETYDAFSRTAILHVPLLPPEDQHTVRHDLVLLPPQ